MISFLTQDEVMHWPGPESFQSFQYPKKPFRTSAVQSHWYPHYRPASLNLESGFQKHVFNIRDLVVVLFRGSYPEKEEKSSQKIICVESNEALARWLERVGHALQGGNRVRQEMEGSYA